MQTIIAHILSTTLMWEATPSSSPFSTYGSHSTDKQTEVQRRNLISHINNRSFATLCVSSLVIGPMWLQTKLLVISWYAQIQLSFYFIFFLLFSKSTASGKLAPTIPTQTIPSLLGSYIHSGPECLCNYIIQ